MRASVMQPYYYPYAGYFRLFAAVDLFVILDCVQFNRRGRVHRYQKGNKWVTLPIKKTDRDTTKICDLQWQDTHEEDLSPVDFIIGTMRDVCEKLELPFNVVRASSMEIPDSTKGQERIITICQKLGADEYVNSPGGRELYDKSVFEKEGIELTFLPEYKGSYDSIFLRLQNESADDIRKEIMENL